jgi:hypothetical protein
LADWVFAHHIPINGPQNRKEEQVCLKLVQKERKQH